MDVSYGETPRIWELSDSSSSDGEGPSSVREGSVNTLSSNEETETEQPDLRLARSDPGVSLDTLGLTSSPDRLGTDSAPESDSDTASCGSSSGRLFATFRRKGDDDGDSDDDECGDEDEDGMGASASCGNLPPTGSGSGKGKPSSSSKAVLTSLRKSWKKVKKTGVKSTTSAGKSLSSLSSSYFSTGRSDATSRETWEERHSRMGDEWLSSIIPNWQKKKKTTRVRTLVFRGIPANVRGRAWQCAIGNTLNVSEQLYEVLKERAYSGRMEYIRGRDTVALADGDVGGNGGKAEEMMESERSAHKAIMLDLPRTFPELSFFHAEGSHYEYALRDVLEAFLYLKPDVGYSQGMSFLAAVLLLYMDPYEAFCCFVNMLLHKSCFLHFFKIKMPEVRFYLTVHERLLSEEMPSLHAHFKQHGIEPDLYMINWVMSLYCRALPLDLVTRIWDVYVLDGDVAIFRAALGILRMFMPRLLKMKFEDMAYFLSHIPAEDIQADALLQSIRSVRVVTRKRFRDLFKECEAAHNKEGEKTGDLEQSSKAKKSDQR